MNPERYEQIRVKLATYLNREPSEAEIVNGQNDERLIGWIREDEQLLQKQSIEKIALLTSVDLNSAIIH